MWNERLWVWSLSGCVCHLVVVVGPVAAALRGAVSYGGVGHARTGGHVKGLDVRSG